jgi:hypothetical protein
MFNSGKGSFMLRNLIVLSTVSILSIHTAMAGKDDLDNNNNTVVVKTKNSKFVDWAKQPLVSKEDGVLVNHPNLKAMAPDLALANELSYAVSKKKACKYFLDNLQHYVQSEQIDEVRQILINKRSHFKIYINDLLKDLSQSGWSLALDGHRKLSVIKGKSGSLTNLRGEGVREDLRINEGYIDNHSGIVLYHDETGTLLTIMHGSRADNFLPRSYDWDANLDIECSDHKLNPLAEQSDMVKAHRGFSQTSTRLQNSLQGILKNVLEEKGPKVKRVLFTGHSLGAAISATSCVQAIESLGHMFGPDFDNADQNIFGHYGLSEPASIVVEDVAKLQAKFGKGNFVSYGVRTDPVMRFLRQDFYKGYDALFDEKIRSELGFFANELELGKVRDLMLAASAPEARIRFSQIGYVGFEDFNEVMIRQAKYRVLKHTVSFAGLGKSPQVDGAQDVATTYIGGIHYGGENGIYDYRLPAAIGPKLDEMLVLGQKELSSRNIFDYVEELKALPSMALDIGGEAVEKVKTTALAVDQAYDDSHNAVKVVVGLGGAAVLGFASKTAYDQYSEEEKVSAQKAALVGASAVVVGYSLYKGVQAFSQWWGQPKATETSSVVNNNNSDNNNNKK